MSLKCFFCISISILIILSCGSPKIVRDHTDLSSDQQSFLDWKQSRLDNLKAPSGWLTITALIWLNENELTIGTDDSFDVTIPYPASANFGTLLRENDAWTLRPVGNKKLTHNGLPIQEDLELHHDQSGKATFIGYESLSWYIIKRGDNYGIRVKDSLNQARFDLESLATFDYNPAYVFDADVVRGEVGDSILITNAQGVVTSNKVVGWLRFEYEKKIHSLTFIDGGTETWFTVYGDETNSGETYGAGRFLYINVPDDVDKVKLDFNRSENPPCYHTMFATCPLPPKENKLKTSIYAGEQSEH